MLVLSVFRFYDYIIAREAKILQFVEKKLKKDGEIEGKWLIAILKGVKKTAGGSPLPAAFSFGSNQSDLPELAIRLVGHY